MPTKDAIEGVNRYALESGITESISLENRMYVRDHLMYYFVIEKRKPQLDSMKTAFHQSPLLKFLSGRDFLIQGLFPRNEDLNFPKSLVTSKISYDDDHPHAEFVKDFINDQGNS